MSEKLYRYISFEDFINLVINHKDRFTCPSSWEDEYEGYLFSCMETREDIYNIVSELYSSWPSDYYPAIYMNCCRMWYIKNFTYAQCWSEHEETDAMWRCYSHGNKAIRIRTTHDKLLEHAKNIFPEKESFKVELKEVKYDLSKEITIKYQVSQMVDSQSIAEPYFHKRSVFEHEKEYRLLITDNRFSKLHHNLVMGQELSEIEKGIKKKFEEEAINYLTDKIWERIEELKTGYNKTNYRIENTENISVLLEGVMVHPLASKWYVELIEDICKKNKVQFDGQSQIYKLK